MTATTYAAAAILGVGLYRALQNTPSMEHKLQNPASALGGSYSTGTGVSEGNNAQYVSDSSQVASVGRDVYGVPCQDVIEPDGSIRRVYGSWSSTI
jgi:hypothetical protein